MYNECARLGLGCVATFVRCAAPVQVSQSAGNASARWLALTAQSCPQPCTKHLGAVLLQPSFLHASVFAEDCLCMLLNLHVAMLRWFAKIQAKYIQVILVEVLRNAANKHLSQAMICALTSVPRAFRSWAMPSKFWEGKNLNAQVGVCPATPDGHACRIRFVSERVHGFEPKHCPNLHIAVLLFKMRLTLPHITPSPWNACFSPTAINTSHQASSLSESRLHRSHKLHAEPSLRAARMSCLASLCVAFRFPSDLEPSPD